MKNRTLIIIIAVLAIVLLFSTCQCSRNRKDADDNLAAITDTVTHFKNKLGTVTASIKTLQLDNNQAKQLLIDKDAQLAALASEFAKVHSIAKFSTVTTLPSIPIVYHDTVPCVFERTGTIKQSWYSFRYRSNQKGVEFDTLSFPNTATVITGTKRKWFLGKETLTTDITNTNPYIKVTGITAAEINIPVPWYKKWYLWFAAGIVGGVFVSK